MTREMQGAGVPVDYVCSQKVGKVTSVYSLHISVYSLYTLCLSLDTTGPGVQ